MASTDASTDDVRILELLICSVVRCIRTVIIGNLMLSLFLILPGCFYYHVYVIIDCKSGRDI